MATKKAEETAKTETPGQPTGGIFGAQGIQEAQQKVEERAKNKKPAPPGIYSAKITEFKLVSSKAGDPMYELTVKLDDDQYAEITDRLSFSKTNNISRDKFIEYCVRGLKIEIEPINESTLEKAVEAMYNQTKKSLLNKPFKVALRKEITLYKKTQGDGSEGLGKFTDAGVWFVLPADDTTTVLPDEGREKVTDNRNKQRAQAGAPGAATIVTESSSGGKPSWLTE